MTVQEVYEQYMIPSNLQEHMLRVGALAEILLDNWQGVDINKDAVVKACLLHDIAKPMHFDLTKQVQFGLSEAEIGQLARLQERLKEYYGEDEHVAIMKICKELGCEETTLRLVDNLEWDYIPKLLKENDVEALIPIYCDMRIGPKGMMSMEERVEDLKKRELNQDHSQKVENGRRLEELVVSNVRVDVNGIKDREIEAMWLELRKMKVGR